MSSGGLINKVNAPTVASASGVWTLEEAFFSRAVNTWPGSPIEIFYLIAAGGGGGGSGYTYDGGGGAGGYLTGTYMLHPLNSSMSITVGAGGAAYSNGSNSMFGNYIAIGGGFGGTYGGSVGSGGSGGGASVGGSPGLGTSSQGYAGGASSGNAPASGCVNKCTFEGHSVCAAAFPGGGGGAGGLGTGVSGGGASPGGPGVTASLPSYSTKVYCAGGPGNMKCAALPAGTAGTGNGGGAKSSGGSGEVVLAYDANLPELASIGAGLQYTVTVSGGYRSYIFTGGIGAVSFV